MKRYRKGILLSLCAVVLVIGTAMGTLAYLTDTKAVTNTFTVGKVGLTLDEAKVNEYGKEIKDAARVQTNKYKLVPGQTYTKDPTVHVDEKSEDAWIFVKVENAIADIEATNNSIASQITNSTNGWTELEPQSGIYWKKWTKGTNAHLEVFQKFTLIGDGLVGGTKPADYTGTDKFIGDYQTNGEDNIVKVTAYAVQASGFDTAAAAWNATFGK